MNGKNNKRISFDVYDASELYELCLEHFQDGCFSCEEKKKRLEKFIGPEEVKIVKRIIRKTGYCNRLKKMNNKKVGVIATRLKNKPINVYFYCKICGADLPPNHPLRKNKHGNKK